MEGIFTLILLAQYTYISFNLIMAGNVVRGDGAAMQIKYKLLRYSKKGNVRGVIDKFVSFFHRVIIYEWIYLIFCHNQQLSVVNPKKT